MEVEPVALAEFFQFLQCQLCLEASVCMDCEMKPEDPGAVYIWPLFKQWTLPNLGKKEKWVPFHTVLGPHELFVVESIHHNKDLNWDEYQRFVAMFIFRAHCQKNVFCEAQLPHLQTKAFWQSPKKYFADDGAITLAMLRYRRETRQPLQTSAFRMIPKALLEDKDENLVANLARRTQRLLDIALAVWPLLGKKLSREEKFEEISRAIQMGYGFGETWAKMLMCTVDIAYPHHELLATHCDVGIGARQGLLRLLPEAAELRSALRDVTRAMNGSSLPSARHFWNLLGKVESLAQQRFAHLPLVLAQVSTRELNVATVQVQLCEWRQFHDFLRRYRAGPSVTLDDPEEEVEETQKEEATLEATLETTLEEPEVALRRSRAEFVELSAQEEDALWSSTSREYLEVMRSEQQVERELQEAKLRLAERMVEEEALNRAAKGLDASLSALAALDRCPAAGPPRAVAAQQAQLRLGAQQLLRQRQQLLTKRKRGWEDERQAMQLLQQRLAQLQRRRADLYDEVFGGEVSPRGLRAVKLKAEISRLEELLR